MKKIFSIFLVVASLNVNAFEVFMKGSKEVVISKRTRSGNIIFKKCLIKYKDDCAYLGSGAYSLESLNNKLTSETWYLVGDSVLSGGAALAGALFTLTVVLSFPQLTIPAGITAFTAGGVVAGGTTYAVTDIWDSPLEHQAKRKLLKILVSDLKIYVDSMEQFTTDLDELLGDIQSVQDSEYFEPSDNPSDKWLM